MRGSHLVLGLFLSCALAAPSTSDTGSVTGNQLYEACTSSEIYQQTFCTGYIIGVNEGLPVGNMVGLFRLGVTFETSEETNDFIRNLLEFCVPDEATNEQLRDIVTKHLRENPEHRHHSARFSVLMALQSAFPCGGTEE